MLSTVSKLFLGRFGKGRRKARLIRKFKIRAALPVSSFSWSHPLVRIIERFHISGIKLKDVCFLPERVDFRRDPLGLLFVAVISKHDINTFWRNLPAYLCRVRGYRR